MRLLLLTLCLVVASAKLSHIVEGDDFPLAIPGEKSLTIHGWHFCPASDARWGAPPGGFKCDHMYTPEGDGLALKKFVNEDMKEKLTGLNKGRKKAYEESCLLSERMHVAKKSPPMFDLYSKVGGGVAM